MSYEEIRKIADLLLDSNKNNIDGNMQKALKIHETLTKSERKEAEGYLESFAKRKIAYEQKTKSF